MEFQYFGANCVKISTKKSTITIDDTLAELGLKSVTKPGDIALFTGVHNSTVDQAKIVLDKPGEYEVSDISIQGIPARAHIDESGTQQATMYRVLIDDIRIAIVGHVYPSLSSSQLEQLNVVDVLIIPVGGSGYTLDPIGALKLIKDIDPKVVIPTHYDDSAISYPVPQQSLEEAIKALGIENYEELPKLKFKSSSDVGDSLRVVSLERQ